MKLAIFSPNILPVPAIDGGAVEELTTYIIEENEKYHNYDIDLYTIDNDDKLKTYNYKYTNLIRMQYIPNYKKEKFISFCNKFLIRLPNGRIKSNFSQVITSKYKRNYYDAVLVEDNRQIFNSIVSKIKNERLYFHIHDDIYISDNELNKIQKLLHRMIEGIIKSSTKIITASHYLEKRFKRFNASNVTTLYNVAIKKDLSLLSPMAKDNFRAKYKISKKRYSIYFYWSFCK